jgi:predicted ABC-type ATPase
MSQPRMVIIAGPPGAGKSSILSLSDFAENVFNADDRAAELNAGSYQSIPLSVRATVNREFERFVYANITAGTSFALETTLLP